MSENRVRIRLFGALRIEVEGSQVAEFSDRKQDVLLALLALPPGSVHRRADLAAVLWPSHQVSDARSRLAEAVYRLRGELAAVGAPAILRARRHTLALDSAVATDVEEFTSLARRLQGTDGPVGMLALEQALEIYGPGLLPLMTGTTAIDTERIRLRSVMERVAQQLERQLEPAGAAARIAAPPPSQEDFVRLDLPVARAPDRTSTGKRGIERRLAEQCLADAESAAKHLDGPDRRSWIERLRQRDEELQFAVDWALDAGETAIAVRLCGALWRYWLDTGDIDRGRVRLERALDLEPIRDAPEYGHALQGAGALAMERGYYAQAAGRTARAARLWLTLGDLEQHARCLSNLGVIALRSRDYDEARRQFHAAAGGFSELGLARLEADVLKNVALTELSARDPDAAEAPLRRRLELLEPSHDSEALGWTYVDLATVAQQRSDWQRAAADLAKARAYFEEAPSARGLAFCCLSLGNVHLETGEYEDARASLSDAQALYHRLNDRRGEGQAVRYLGDLAVVEHRLEEARHLYARSLLLLQEAGDERSTQIVVEALAALEQE